MARAAFLPATVGVALKAVPALVCRNQLIRLDIAQGLGDKRFSSVNVDRPLAQIRKYRDRSHSLKLKVADKRV